MFIDTSVSYFTTCFGPMGHHQVNHKPFSTYLQEDFVSQRIRCFLVLHTLSVYLLQYNYYLMPLFTILF
jgi:hypothetical protein